LRSGWSVAERAALAAANRAEGFGGAAAALRPAVGLSSPGLEVILVGAGERGWVWDVTRRASPRGRRSVGRWRLAGRARPSEVRLVVGSLATLERARSAAPRRSPIGAPSMSVDEKGTQADGVVKDKRCYASQVSLCSHRSAATSSSPSSSDPASLRIRVVSLDRSPVGSDGGAAARAPAGPPSNADSEVDDVGRDPARCQGQALVCASA
jgi:hypothetical protein